MAELAAVVVVCHRPGQWLQPCVESALAQPAEVVVVDNGSEGEEASAIARRLGARLVRLARNAGFAAGANAGLRAATRSEIVALLNDDAVASRGWLASATRLLEDPEVAAVTPKVLFQGLFAEIVLDDRPHYAPGDSRPLGRMVRSLTVGGIDVIDSAVGAGIHRLEHGEIGGAPARWRWSSGPQPFYAPVPEEAASSEVLVNGEPQPQRALVRVVNHAGSYLRDSGMAGEHGLGAPDDGRFDSAAERFGFSGTAPVFRTETLRRLGGFPEPFFAYNEDTDWCLRARLAGMRILYDPMAVVHHRHSATSAALGERHLRYLLRRNALLCLVRNAPPSVAAGHLTRQLMEGPGEGVRRSVMRYLPWAASSRLSMRRLWKLSPYEVWGSWAERDTAWDNGPSDISASSASSMRSSTTGQP
jgi:GT2 family glycosyltransferase